MQVRDGDLTPTVPPLGATDCESIGEGWLAQPVGAFSSLAFVAGAGWLWWTRGGPKAGTAATAYAAIMGSVGVGSWWFHGPQGAPAQLMHDGTIAVLVAAAVGVPLLRVLRGRPALADGTTARGGGVVVGVLAAAGGAYALGRTGSPVCRPDSLLQAHGLWHVLAAAAFGLWGASLWARRA